MLVCFLSEKVHQIKKSMRYCVQLRYSHTYYSDIRRANKEMFTQLHVYNNVTLPIPPQKMLI